MKVYKGKIKFAITKEFVVIASNDKEAFQYLDQKFCSILNEIKEKNALASNLIENKEKREKYVQFDLLGDMTKDKGIVFDRMMIS